MSGERYKSGHHLPKVKRAAKVRLGTRLVLNALCDRAEFDKPEVTITKSQIAKLTCLERKAIQRALAHLRKIGTIVALEGLEGGRGVATRYRLCVIGEGAEAPPEAGGRGADFPSYEQWQADQGGLKRTYSDYLADKRQHEKKKL